MNSIQRRTNILTYFLIAALIANPFSHYLQNLYNIGNPYYASYIIWTILFVYTTIFLTYKRSTKWMFLGLIQFFFMVLGCINGNTLYGSLSNIHTGLFIFLAFWATMCRSYKVEFTKDNLYLIFNALIFLGIIASVYALIYQTSMYILALSGVDSNLNGWGVKSFFSQRNIFAQYCAFCSIPACYMYIDTRRKIYIIPLILFCCNIFATNSRASIIFYAISVFPPMFLHIKKKIFILVGICICLLIFPIDKFSVEEVFLHNNAGEDSGETRIRMWLTAFKLLFNDISWLTGFGFGSISFITSKIDGVGSAHNFYVDSFFSGGVVYLLIYLYSMFYAYRISRKNKDKAFRLVFTYSIIAYAVYCMLESGSGLFASNFFSITATILLVIIPRIYKCLF